MALKLVFLGKLEQAAGSGELLLDLTGPTTLAGVLARLDGTIGEALSATRIRFALNGELVPWRGDLPVNDGDELAFLPPVSGG
jgi:molybdopterin synthase sulfur carrier subunit